ncbi:MAG TPA: efflux RND transporter periplasmic adaptor subunit [Bacteroidia bacterium]|nr:efflux RND transporter periplasmic adaptor subunit [Bacteroidia bacterium]
MKKHIALYFLFLLIIACKSKENSESNNAIQTENLSIVSLNEIQIKNTGIVLGKLETKSMASILKVNGSIDVPPQNMVSISVPLGGFLKYTKLLPGMHLSKGEAIATMEDQQYIQLQQDYLSALSSLKYAELEYHRQKELNDSKAASNKTLEQAESTFQNFKINTKSLYEKLKLIGINPDNLTEKNISRSIEIHSPIDGYVSHVNVNIGKYVNPTDVLFELVNPADIHLNLTIYEKDLDKLFIGQKLMAYNNHKPEIKYPCEIILIGKDISADRSVEVHCHFEKYDKTLIPGMFMNADVEINSDKAKVLPDDAIVRFENMNYVFYEKSKNTFEMLEVSIGNNENGLTEIKMDDSFDNYNFVYKGAYNLLMQLKNKGEEE